MKNIFSLLSLKCLRPTLTTRSFAVLCFIWVMSVAVFASAADDSAANPSEPAAASPSPTPVNSSATDFIDNPTRPRFLELGLAIGRTQMSGDLTDDKVSGFFGFHLNIWGREVDSQTLGGVRGYFHISARSKGKYKSRGGPFPFTTGQDLHIGTSELVPNICVLAQKPIPLCLGVGWSTLRVTTDNDTQDYGPTVWMLTARHHFSERYTLALTTDYTQQDQKTAGVKSKFSLWSTHLAAGVMF